MTAIAATHTSTADPAAVWSVMTDLAGTPATLRSVESVQRLDGGGEFGVGTRWRETRTMFGRSATEEMEVTAVEPGRSYTVEADSSGAHYTSVMSVEPGASGSVLRMSFDGEATGLVGKVMAATVGRLFRSATRKACQQDLVDIAAAAERDA